MTTQIMFKIDSKLKKAVQKKAKEEGITLSSFYQSATRSFVAGELSLGLRFKEDAMENYTAKSQLNFKKGLEEFKSGKFKRVR